MKEINIIATTWCPDLNRMNAFLDAAGTWHTRLQYRGPINIVVSDDGTNSEMFHTIQETVLKHWQRGKVQFASDRAHGVGASLNRGFNAYPHTDIYLYAVDDWRLEEAFDLAPWVQLLEERDDVGVVRLGPPHPGTTMTVKAWTENWQGWAGEIHPTAGGIIVSERPALWHRRMIDQHGYFKEDCSAIECEKDYDERYIAAVGRGHWKKVVLALPHPWMHLEPSTLSGVNPSERR